jgi:hypothetical protein
MHHVTINQKNQKKGRQKEGNLPPRKLSPKKVPPKEQEAKISPSTSKRTGSKNIPKYLQKNRKQKISPSTSKRTGSKKYPQVPPKEQEAKIYPHHRLGPFIQSKLVGSAGPMSPTTKKALLWIGSPWAMAAANTATRLTAATCRLGLAVDRS